MTQPALSVQLRPSPLLAALLIVIHLLAALALAVSLTGLGLGLALAGVALSAVRTAGEALRRWPDSATAVELHQDGRAAWRDPRQRWHEAKLGAAGYVSVWLIIIPLAGPGRVRKWIVIAPDAATADDRRRLRAWLRWRQTKFTPGNG